MQVHDEEGEDDADPEAGERVDADEGPDGSRPCLPINIVDAASISSGGERDPATGRRLSEILRT
jgi:hypothetical protein